MTGREHGFLCNRRHFIAEIAGLGLLYAQGIADGEDRVAPSFRALTYNIRYDNPADGRNGWKHRRDAIAKFIAAEKIDIAGLQEVLIHQAKDLESRLPDYRWYGVGRDDGMEKGELSPIFYRTDRFDRLNAGTFWLAEVPDEVGRKGWDAALPRVCSWVKLRDRSGGEEFFVFNTHFDHQGEEARRKSAALLRRKIPQIAGSRPLVLTGDFNATATDELYATITAGNVSVDGQTSLPLVDSRSISAERPTGPDSTWNGFQEIVPGRRIDFIFVQQASIESHQVLDPRVDGRFLSDHLPVVSQMALARAKK